MPSIKNILFYFSIGLMIFFITPPGIAKDKNGVISGQLFLDEETPLTNAVVLLFDKDNGPPPIPGFYWRIPDNGSRIDSTGKFSISLPAGNYYIGAMKKPDGSYSGLPRLKDWLFLSQKRNGQLKMHQIKPEIHTILNPIIITDPIIADPSLIETIADIEGVITNKKGTPVDDIIVEAFWPASKNEQPLFSSHRTDKNGKFSMRLASGQYILKARVGDNDRQNRSSPKKKEYSKPYKIDIKAGENIKDFSIILK